jgi:hypothetical protein
VSRACNGLLPSCFGRHLDAASLFGKSTSVKSTGLISTYALDAPVRPTDARKFRGNVPRRRPLNGAASGFRENDWDSGMTESWGQESIPNERFIPARSRTTVLMQVRRERRRPTLGALTFSVSPTESMP